MFDISADWVKKRKKFVLGIYYRTLENVDSIISVYKSQILKPNQIRKKTVPASNCHLKVQSSIPEPNCMLG